MNPTSNALFSGLIQNDQPQQCNGRQFSYSHTEFGNAQMFADKYRGKFKYVTELGEFILWDEKTRRWSRESQGGGVELHRNVKRLISARYEEARSQNELVTLNNEHIQKDVALKWAKTSSKRSVIKAMLDFLKNMPGVCISQSTLDSDPCLLGVANGVLDLRTGILRENTPGDLITRYARAAYNPKAKPKKFQKFLNQVCLGRQDLVDFLQEMLGYSLSGLTKEQAFFLLLGTGANGKSTLVETFFHLLGDYAKGMPSHAFIKSESRAIRNDLARLPGVRFAPCAEINTGKSLDESMVKRGTGGDVMTARFIGKEFFDFHLVAKFFFSVNTLPHVTGADNGIYRRLIVIPFDGNFEATMDGDLPKKLKGEIDGILAWAVQGFQRWSARGHLVKPDCVIEACKAYRAEMDTVQAFLDECCTLDPLAKTPLGVLFEASQQWAKSAIIDPVKPRLFSTLMGQKGFKKRHSGPWRWLGVALKASPTVVQTSLFGPALDSSSNSLTQ